jgi:HEPN domain-containing protein
MLGLDNETINVAREWVEKAEKDFDTATVLMRMRKQRLLEPICFHAQQCVEKYLKTLLIVNQVEPPRTHNLDIVYALIPSAVRPPLTKLELNRLTEYAVIPRYPGDYDPITVEDAEAAMRVMRRVRADIRRRLSAKVTDASKE